MSDTIDENNRKLLNEIHFLGKIEVLDDTINSSIFSDTKANAANPYETFYAQLLVDHKNNYKNYATQLSKIEPNIAALIITEDLATLLNASLLILVTHTKDIKNGVFSEIEQCLVKLRAFNLEIDNLKSKEILDTTKAFFTDFSETTQKLNDNMTFETFKDTKERDLLAMCLLLNKNINI